MDPNPERDLERFREALDLRFGQSLVTLAAFGSQVEGRQHGDEDDLLPPSELFEKAEAAEAMAAVERLLALYRDLVEVKKR